MGLFSRNKMPVEGKVSSSARCIPICTQLNTPPSRRSS
jgi:hypothetical protein